MANIKYSRQRESIKHFLAGRKDHPTADIVYQNLRQIYPNISLGTVYRNLGLLSELGEINRIHTGDGAERFDYNTRPHNHFVCRCCHNVFDLEMENIDHIMETAQKNFCGQIEGYTATFVGVCENCREHSVVTLHSSNQKSI